MHRFVTHLITVRDLAVDVTAFPEQVSKASVPLATEIATHRHSTAGRSRGSANSSFIKCSLPRGAETMLLFDQFLKFLVVAPNRILLQTCVLGILLFVRILLAARLDASRILLVYNKYGLPSNHTLRIENDDLNDCYEWKTVNEHLVTVEPLYDRSDCSNAAVVSVISSAAERMITRLTAKGRSGIELNCDVITDLPEKLELTYLTDELPVDAPPEVLTVIAKDKFGHAFTSINGLKFDWKLQQNLDESIKFSDSIVARLRPYSSSNGHPDGWILRGLLGHSVLVETLNAGTCKIKASVKLTDTLEISTEEVRLSILPRQRVFPSSVIRLLRYGNVHLETGNVQGKDSKKGFKISVEKPEVADLKEDSSLLTALEYGETHVTLESDDNEFGAIDVNIEVVKAAKIGIRISGGEYTILEELKSYFISIDLFDENDKLIFPSDNLKLSVTFPTSFYVNSSTSNGTWHFVQTLTPGKGKIRAELKGVVLSDGSLLKEKSVLQTSKIVTVSQKLTIYPPFSLLPSDSLNSSFHEIRLMATGGTGKYWWASNNNEKSAVEIRFDDEKSNVGHLQIHNEGDFIVTVTDRLNVNLIATAKVSVQPVIDIETYPTVVETHVSNTLILPVALLAYEDKERKTIRKFDDCSKILPTVEIIEKHVFAYDEEPHIPAFGKGCRNLQFSCKFPGHSRINVEYQAKDKILKTTTVLACFKDLKPVHPVRVAVLSLGSSMEVAFDGGPRRWPLFKKGHYTTLEPSKPELLSIELVRDPIRYNKDLTVFRILCKELGENTLTFRIGNEPSATNPHPARSESTIKVVCSEPHSVHLKLFKKEKKKDFKNQKNIVKVPFYGEKKFAVDVWLKDSVGRKIYNFSTVDLKWSLSDETLASVEGGQTGFQTYENAVAGYRKITRDFKEFKMTGGTGALQIKAEILGYHKDALTKVGITKSDNLKDISGSIDLNLVSLRDINAGFYANDDNEKQEKEGTCDGDSCTE